MLDIQGNATIDNAAGQAGPANFGNTGWPGVAHMPVIKPSDGAVLTITGEAGFLVDASSVPTIELDVSNLTPSAVWTTIIQAGTITAGSDVGFVAGTGPEWDLQVDPNNDLQLKYESPAIMGDVDLSGYVDDDGLSLLLAGWGTGTTWGEGDLDASGDVGDDDLSLLLASWGDGTPRRSPNRPRWCCWRSAAPVS